MLQDMGHVKLQGIEVMVEEDMEEMEVVVLGAVAEDMSERVEPNKVAVAEDMEMVQKEDLGEEAVVDIID